MSFDAIGKSIALAKDAEAVMFGLTRPKMSPHRERQANDARNIIRRYIREMERVRLLYEEEMKSTAADPESPFYRNDWYET